MARDGCRAHLIKVKNVFAPHGKPVRPPLQQLTMQQPIEINADSYRMVRA